jgi:predicted outer membrane repeat protein
MERSILYWVCVCALVVLPLVGCSDETAAAGGTGGTGGSGDTRGDGGTGGMPECESTEDCDDGNECTDDTCSAGVCEFEAVPDATGPDEPGGPPGDGTTCGYYEGTCEGGSCAGTFACTEAGIREAIAAGAGPHTFDCADGTILVTEAEIVIDNDVILDGEGDLTVDGDESHRVFAVAEGVAAELRGLTVTEGAVSGFEYGGGIHNLGMLTLTNSAVSGNTAYRGGGIHSNRTLTLTNSTVSGNTASRVGGGIDSGGTLTLTNSTVSGNTASQPSGGGIYSLGTLTLTNSTVSGNSGTGIDTHFMAMLTNSTVSGDGASGAAIHNEGSPKGPVSAVLTITNSTVSGIISNDPVWGTSTVANSVLDGECNGAPVTSDGYNIESPGNTCGFDPDGTDQVNMSAEQLNLGELADNGGPTMTHALLSGSVAIDVIPADMCEVDEDQRGEPRDSMCDVGAFEVQP